jgi:hypothetical protein
VLYANIQIRANRGDASAHVRDTIDDHEAVGAAPDHAVSAAWVCEAWHGAKDAVAGSKERHGERFALTRGDRAAVNVKGHHPGRGERGEDRVFIDSGRAAQGNR